MPRFFVPPAALEGDVVTLTGESAAHAKVLRLMPGEEVTLCDGAGREARTTVLALEPGLVRLKVEALFPSESEPQLRVSVYMGFPKADKLEHVVQKATELGAWQKIAASAAEQSGRGRIPQVLTLPSFDAAVARASQADWAALFYEKERDGSIAATLPPELATAAILTGPEGGLTEAEVDKARQAGVKVCTLGKRILRCETAPLCALSALLYAAGELE